MSAQYTDGLIISIPDGDELSFDDGASALFDFDAYSLSMTMLNTSSGIFDIPLMFSPTPALVGLHLGPGEDGFATAAVMEHPCAVLAGSQHDIATNTAMYLVQTAYGRARHLASGMTPGAFMYATLAGYAMSGDKRDIVGIASSDGMVLLDVFETLDQVRGIPASAFMNPAGGPQAAREEVGNALAVLLYDGTTGYGLGTPVFEPGDVTYRIPITVPLNKPPVVALSMCALAGTGKYITLVDTAVDHIRVAFYGSTSNVRVQNTSKFNVRAIGTTYTEL